MVRSKMVRKMGPGGDKIGILRFRAAIFEIFIFDRKMARWGQKTEKQKAVCKLGTHTVILVYNKYLWHV